ncbi:MAG: hypothetical protein K6T34_05805 [Thermoflavifilum sp.]|nr:hypothetical protein [Thermoflavifilum sp.]
MINIGRIERHKLLWAAILLVLFIAVVGISYAYSASIAIGGAVLAIITFITILLVSIGNPLIAFYLCILYGAFIYFLQRLLDLNKIPVSVGGEFIVASIFIGVILRKILHHERIWKHTHNIITYTFVVSVVYYGLEVFNPNAYPPVGWVKIYPLVVMGFLFYLIALYLFNNKQKIFFFIKFWIALATIVAMYGCIQQWVGLPPWEYAQLMKDPHTFGILYQSGFIRKYSTLSDPAAFGVFLSGTIVFLISLLLMRLSRKRMAMIILCMIFMLLGVTYSGTRTAIAIIPMGILFLGLLTIQNKKNLLIVGSIVLIGAILILSPLQNGVLNRVRSTFRPNNDPSMIVRDLNRKSKQYYMHHHPIGGGLKTTGLDALMLYPNHPLAGFPTDSVFVQNALEIGWVGFLIQLIIYFIILKFAIHEYYHQTNQKEKMIFAGFAAALFTWFMADYSQGAVSNFSISFIYNGILAAMIKLKFLNQEKNLI